VVGPVSKPNLNRNPLTMKVEICAGIDQQSGFGGGASFDGVAPSLL